MNDWCVLATIADESVPKWIPKFIRKWIVTREFTKLLRAIEDEPVESGDSEN